MAFEPLLGLARFGKDISKRICFGFVANWRLSKKLLINEPPVWEEQQWLGAAQPLPVLPGLQLRQSSHPASWLLSHCVLLSLPLLVLPLAQLRGRGQEGTGSILRMWARSWEMQQEQIWSFKRVQECWACVFEEEGFTLPTSWGLSHSLKKNKKELFQAFLNENRNFMTKHCHLLHHLE